MGERARRFVALGRPLRWLAPAAFAIAVLAFVDVRSVGATLARLDARFAAAFLPLSAIFYALCAWRWHLTATSVGAPLTFRRAFFDYYVATLLNQVLPFGVAGDVVRAARHKGRVGGASWGPPARAVVLERLSGVLALALFVAASAGMWLARGQRPFGVVLAAALASIVVLAALLRARGALAVQLAASVASVAILLLMFACAARAVGVTLDAPNVVLVVPLILAATTIPWAFAGWGAREVTTAALFGLAGIGAAQGVAVSIAFGVLSLAAAAPGVLVLCVPEARRRSSA